MVKFTEGMRSNVFERVPPGVTILKVLDMKEMKTAGKVMEYNGKFVDSKGRMIFNRYNCNKNSAHHLPSMRAFYSLLKTGCQLEENEEDEIDPKDAINKFFIATIKEVEKGDRIFTNLGFILGSAKSFEDDISEQVKKEEEYQMNKKKKEEDAPPEEKVEDDPYA